MVLVEGFLGIGALSESTFEESMLGRKESMWCCILRNNMNTWTVKQLRKHNLTERLATSSSSLKSPFCTLTELQDIHG